MQNSFSNIFFVKKYIFTIWPEEKKIVLSLFKKKKLLFAEQNCNKNLLVFAKSQSYNLAAKIIT